MIPYTCCPHDKWWQSGGWPYPQWSARPGAGDILWGIAPQAVPPVMVSRLTWIIPISGFCLEGKTTYHLETIIKETGTSVDDGIHRLFVNCAVNDGSDIAELMQYFKNSTGRNNKFPKLSDRVYYFKESKEGSDAMTQVVEEYANKKVLERDKETAKSFLQNGASVELVKKSIPTLSVEFIEKLRRQLTAAEQ